MGSLISNMIIKQLYTCTHDKPIKHCTISWLWVRIRITFSSLTTTSNLLVHVWNLCKIFSNKNHTSFNNKYIQLHVYNTFPQYFSPHVKSLYFYHNFVISPKEFMIQKKNPIINTPKISKAVTILFPSLYKHIHLFIHRHKKHFLSQHSESWYQTGGRKNITIEPKITEKENHTNEWTRGTTFGDDTIQLYRWSE